MTASCFKIHPKDNVATLLDDAPPGIVTTRGSDDSVILTEAIALGHKVALCDIAADGPIIKFGVPIGTASQTIQRGDWVHLHNCRSNFDARSATLDLHSGTTTDMRYD
ncbi:MAG TPA: UxaA family hydrolase [Telmatospirillum sp.]|nr:UxaA family hydrolase [Telmatospirillum sp.]